MSQEIIKITLKTLLFSLVGAKFSIVEDFLAIEYCDVPGSPCLSKTGPVVGPSFSIYGSLSLG